MHNPIPEPSYPVPIYIWIPLPYFFWQSVRGLSDNLKISDNRINSSAIGQELFIRKSIRIGQYLISAFYYILQ